MTSQNKAGNDPRQLLQIVHNRAEQWWNNPQAINGARKAAQDLDAWIVERLTYVAPKKPDPKKET